MKKILITGGAGLLGVNLALRISNNYKIYTLLNKKIINIPSTLNNIDMKPLEKIFDEFSPNLVINTVAKTNIEMCEEKPLIATEVNFNYSKKIVELCKINKCKLVHISTDHLSDGSKSFVKENQEVVPLNQYALTKSLAEKYILKEMTSAIIVRTNFFGWGPKYRNSFSDKIINEISNSKYVSLFEDAFFSPVSIRRLCKIIIMLFENEARGIFNVSSNERISKLKFGLMLCDNFKLNKEYVLKAKMIERSDLIVRPRDTSLNNQKVTNFLNYNCGSADENIKDLFQDIKDGIKEEVMKL